MVISKKFISFIRGKFRAWPNIHDMKLIVSKYKFTSFFFQSHSVYLSLSLVKQCPIKSISASQYCASHMGLITSTNYWVNIFFFIAEQTARSTFIQLTFIQLSRQLFHIFSFITEILLECIFHSITFNQPPEHSISWKYSTSWKSFLKMDKLETIKSIND